MLTRAVSFALVVEFLSHIYLTDSVMVSSPTTLFANHSSRSSSFCSTSVGSSGSGGSGCSGIQISVVVISPPGIGIFNPFL